MQRLTVVEMLEQLEAEEQKYLEDMEQARHSLSQAERSKKSKEQAIEAANGYDRYRLVVELADTKKEAAHKFAAYKAAAHEYIGYAKAITDMKDLYKQGRLYGKEEQ